MIREEVSLEIRRPVGVVFTYMDDVSREPEWQPNLKEADQSPPGPSQVGTEKRYVSEFMGRRVENTYVAKVVVPEVRVVYETTRDSTLQASSEIRWEAVEAGTRVTMIVEGKPAGVLRFIPRALLERAYRDELRSTLARLKTKLEETG